MKSLEMTILSSLHTYAPMTLTWVQLQSILMLNGYIICAEKLRDTLQKLIFNQQVIPIAEEKSQTGYRFREVVAEKKDSWTNERAFRR
jgi:hypothetical protein